MKNVISALIFVLCASQIAMAGSISITVTARPSEIEDSCLVNMSLQNKGDEAAEDVRVSLLLPDGFVSEGINIGRLIPGVLWNGSITVNRTGSLLPGLYPAIILTQYKDANYYQFSSVSKNNLIYKENPYSDISSGTIKNMAISDEGILVVPIRNLGNSTRDVKIRLYLPMEIAADEYEKEISLGGRDVKDVVFKLSNLGALSGSSYFVVAAIEYDDSMHYSYLASTVVEIREKDSSGDMFWLLVVSFAVLGSVLAVYKLKSRKKAKQ